MPSLDETRTLLKQHFEGSSPAGSNKWNDLWTKDFLPWDRGLPNPALQDLLSTRQSSLPRHAELGRRPSALVPGCGRGYDVLLLASWGYDCVGLEISAVAVDRCLKEQESPQADYPVQNTQIGAGTARFINGDFFQEDWLNTVGIDKFDLIYDYTFFCAMQPAVRPAWAKRMSSLLASQGRLITLEFPTTKDPKLGGPPFASPSIAYVQHLSHPGMEIPYGEDAKVDDEVAQPCHPGALQRLEHWQPERTHEIGSGSDWVGIWAHRD